MSDFRFDFDPDERGWADARFCVLGWNYATRVSFLSDPLHEVARIAVARFDHEQGDTIDEARFDAEGGRLLLLVPPIGASGSPSADPNTGEEDLSLRFEDLRSGTFGLWKPDERLPYEAKIHVWSFSVEILRTLEQTYDRFGASDYYRRFWLDFPTTPMLRLREVLGRPPIERRLS